MLDLVLHFQIFGSSLPHLVLYFQQDASSYVASKSILINHLVRGLRQFQ